MKFSVFTVMTPEYSPAEIVKILSRLGYDGVEWRVQHLDPSYANEGPSYWRNNRCTIELETILEHAEEIRDLSIAAGLEICALSSYLLPHERERIEHVVQAAQIMGAPKIRINTPPYDRSRRYYALFREIREQLLDLQNLSRAYGVQILVEIHFGKIIPSASSAYRLIEGMDPSCIGVIYDPGNMIYEGYEAWRMGLEILGDYLAHVHVKNARWRPGEKDESGTLHWIAESARVNEGVANWGEILADLRAVGYDGYLSFEDFSSGMTTDEKLSFNLAYMRRLLAELE